MRTTGEWGSPRPDEVLDRVAAWACAAITGVFLILVVLVPFTKGRDESLRDYVTGEPALMPALFILASLALAAAAVGHRPVWRRSMAVGGVVVVIVAVSQAPVYPGLVYLALLPAVVILASTVMPVQLARIALLAAAGYLCLMPLGYFILPAPISVAALGRSATLARDSWRESRGGPS